jgi:hypothetical protein
MRAMWQQHNPYCTPRIAHQKNAKFVLVSEPWFVEKAKNPKKSPLTTMTYNALEAFFAPPATQGAGGTKTTPITREKKVIL